MMSYLRLHLKINKTDLLFGKVRFYFNNQSNIHKLVFN